MSTKLNSFADPLYATILELNDGDAEIGLLSSLLPTTAEPGPAFPMQALMRKYRKERKSAFNVIFVALAP
jgi:hypothetical protein